MPLELYAADLPLAFLVAASSGLFDAVRSAHEPLVRFFEPLSIGLLDPADATRAITGPVEETVTAQRNVLVVGPLIGTVRMRSDPGGSVI